MKPIDLNKETELKKFIKSIEKIQDEHYKSIYIEGYENLDTKVLKELKRNLNIFTNDGEREKISNISMVMKKIFNIQKEDLREKEVLILCDHKEKAKKIIKEVAKECRFITVYGFSEEEGEELYEYILEEIGLSIFHTKNLHSIIDNHSIIINFLDKIDFKNIERKKHSIIFNFATKGKGISSIKDYGYDLKDLGIKETKWIGSIINTEILEFLLGEDSRNIRPKYIMTKENNYFTFKEYIDLFFKIRGRF